jgi:DNA-binding response OmpR family regulator
MKTKILIIDDDAEANRLLSAYLQQFDFEVSSALHPRAGLELVVTEQPALLILDLMLPEKNGLELCKDIRKISNLPIIMVTARGELGDRINGLESGADDYMAKPFEPRELVARIHSVLRRFQNAPVKKAAHARKCGELLVDSNKATASLGKIDLQLTAAEFSILSYLMDHAGTTMSREKIYQFLKGSQWDGVDRSVDMIVSRLRTKLGEDSKKAKYLKTMWGDGYRFVGVIEETGEGK